ncbi:energy transducer TonB [Draconibacterium sp.]|nr:energy transducer TonB [Draconibacterium sp.]
MKVLKYYLPVLFLFSVFTYTVDAQNKVNEKSDVYRTVDEMPVYPGGNDALRNFIAQNVTYPEKAKKEGIRGKVFVSFVINKKGEVSNAKIERGVSPELDKEALRVIKSLPKWTPGKEKGKLAKVQFTVPINFALN